MTRPRLLATTVAIWLLLILLGAAIPARAADEPRFDSLVEHFRTRPLRVLLLLQSGADFQPERSFSGHNGFNIAAAQFGIAGELDKDFAYKVVAGFLGTPSLVDLSISYSPSPSLTVDMGQFKVPFSGEYLTETANIDFVNRAKAISALAPGRQVGMQARGRVADRHLGYAGGLWNGNPGSANGNDNESFLFAGRMAFFPLAHKSDDGAIEAGVCGATSSDAHLNLLGGELTNFSGRRSLGGADIRWTPGPWMMSAEVIGARLEPRSGSRIEPAGFHFTGGRTLTPALQGLVRFERFRPDGLGADQDLVIGGLNITASQAVRIQANYIVPAATGPEHHQFLLKVQVGFGK